MVLVHIDVVLLNPSQGRIDIYHQVCSLAPDGPSIVSVSAVGACAAEVEVLAPEPMPVGWICFLGEICNNNGDSVIVCV